MAASKGLFGRGNRKSSRGGSGAEKRLCEVGGEKVNLHVSFQCLWQ